MEDPITSEPNQKEIDRQSAELLRDTFCFEHQRPMRRYIDGVWACPDCEADKVQNYPVSPYKEMF